VRQGEIGSSFYIILDGKVRILTEGQNGKAIPVTVLSDGQFFGEMSFLTGTPRSATVKAVDNSYLCEINAEALREIIYQWPAIKTTLVKYYRERLTEIQEEKKAAGMDEYRNSPRFSITLPINFQISSPPHVAEKYPEKIFRCLSTDISLSGVRVKAQDADLLTLPIGCHINMEIALPDPWDPICCEGILKNRSEGGKTYDYIGVEFARLPESKGNKLKQFLYG
jgi:hypothetical protein